ncbi:hypothetical protein DDB_G0277207 [Dictyostelium discoideum AX4]|uniref:Uncharacterized protein n=1 Tax=Dictyostelium discoideum TaxID=44689 RepID=Q86K92_DICDI|nr:hypothetical protein DDB_G0277207 [Dictyostelium discoideum AX4]EAL68789.1 hypothetical protein DDB_G0277207 [Dictyostelium discoideum AX4]|eukprot:XP_642682.1 hypothetical protein DDB_G0277207 [Dictyostelium discoideum AX4]
MDSNSTISLMTDSKAELVAYYSGRVVNKSSKDIIVIAVPIIAGTIFFTIICLGILFRKRISSIIQKNKSNKEKYNINDIKIPQSPSTIITTNSKNNNSCNYLNSSDISMVLKNSNDNNDNNIENAFEIIEIPHLDIELIKFKK